MSAILDKLEEEIEISSLDALKKAWVELPRNKPTTVILSTLRAICAKLDKELIIFFDEADCLSDDVLITFLRQLRDGYERRSKAKFPRSIALIGMRNIRDYKSRIRPDSKTLGSASPFNIITKALTLANFTEAEVKSLYAQHTEATGQVFKSEAVERAWYWSEGQPWLVNALAKEVIEEILVNNYTATITGELVDQAAENLIIRRDTHIDSLLERLKEPRVRSVMDPVFASTYGNITWQDDDLKYCFDLGLITEDQNKTIRPSNPIYGEVMIRVLTYAFQKQLPTKIVNLWMDGQKLHMSDLLKEFQRFWAENSESWLERFDYKESAPHFVLQAFLQRVVNGGATILREYAFGRMRVDLNILYAGHSYPLELKLVKPENPVDKALNQMAKYLDKCREKEGWIVYFDRDSEKSWEQKISWNTNTLPDGQLVHVVGC
jgi:hypothetical protein